MSNEDKPYVICNMMISLDGKISFGTIGGKDVDYPIFWDYMDQYEEMEKTYGNDYSYIVGRTTMDEVDLEEEVSLEEFKGVKVEENEDFKALVEYTNFAVYPDIKGKLRWKDNFRGITGPYGLVAIVNSETPKEYLVYLRSKNISYIFGGEDKLNFELIFSKLKNIFGVKKLLLEGGGLINGAVIQEDLIDEISLMILPFVVNNTEAPALFDSHPTIPTIYNYKLDEVINMDKGIVRLRYLK